MRHGFFVISGMNKELHSIIRHLEHTLSGEPWYGKGVYTLLEEANPADVFKKPGDTSHSMADLLYHMINWAQFTLESVRGNPEKEPSYFEQEEADWRVIHPADHSWENGVTQLKATHRQLVDELHTKDDSFLELPVKGRKYNYRYLLNGLIEHNIYHIGQVAYAEKLPLKF
jgi:uncharacterized damage-inducible protein DinB